MKNSTKKMALVTGFSLLMMAIVAGIGFGYGFTNIYVANDSVATLFNLKHSFQLYQLVIVSFVIVLILDVIVSWSLYHFFKKSKLSAIISWLRIGYSILLGVALLKLVAVIPLLNQTSEDGELILKNIDSFLHIWSFALIIFGFHLLVLGYVVFKSMFIPKAIGVMLIIGAIGYVLSNSANLLVDDYGQIKEKVDAIIGFPLALGELAFAFWMLFKGRKLEIKG